MTDTGKDNPQDKSPAARPKNFEQIDPHRTDQHRPAANSPDRDDENLKGALKQGDLIPDVEMTKPTGNTPGTGTGENAAGGFAESPAESSRLSGPARGK